MPSDHIFHWTPHLEFRHKALTPKQMDAILSIARGETIEEWLSRMNLEHLERILKRGAKAADAHIARVLMAMARECKAIRDEEQAKGATNE